jgi:hypothetical protein
VIQCARRCQHQAHQPNFVAAGQTHVNFKSHLIDLKSQKILLSKANLLNLKIIQVQAWADQAF